MVKSIIDTDLYKLTVSNAYYQLYRSAEGTFKFNDRNHEKYDYNFLKILDEEFTKLSYLKMTDEEYEYLLSIRFLSTNYTEWLKNFQFEKDKIKYYLNDEDGLEIEVTDKLYKSTLYEVPILAIVSEARSKWLKMNIFENDVRERIEHKVNYANEEKLNFSEFGTRRRYSYDVQEYIISYLKRNSKTCNGTSNVYLAMKYNMTPIGTFPHEWVMFHAGIGGFKTANLTALNDWIKVYDGDLGIALIDTYTTKSFLHTLTLKQAKLLDGFRQDSGDEIEVGNMIINKLKSFNIDPTTKTIVFSNALNFEKFKKINDYFKGKIKVAAGIGTNLTNDVTNNEKYKPANIVMKLSKCRYSPRDFWEDVIKISDDTGKSIGNSFKFEIAKNELHLNEL